MSSEVWFENLQGWEVRLLMVGDYFGEENPKYRMPEIRFLVWEVTELCAIFGYFSSVFLQTL
jgi:hypothetical protein